MRKIPCNMENIHYSMEKIHLLIPVSIINNMTNTTIMDQVHNFWSKM